MESPSPLVKYLNSFHNELHSGRNITLVCFSCNISFVFGDTCIYRAINFSSISSISNRFFKCYYFTI